MSEVPFYLGAPLQGAPESRGLASLPTPGVGVGVGVNSSSETLIIYQLGFNQNYFTHALILLIETVLYSEFIEPE